MVLTWLPILFHISSLVSAYRVEDEGHNRRHVRVLSQMKHLQEESDLNDMDASSLFIEGNLGRVQVQDRHLVDANYHEGNAFVAAAKEIMLRDILAEQFELSGHEDLVTLDDEIHSGSVYVDDDGNSHVRFQEVIDGIPVAGSAIMMHITADEGLVYAINGEFFTVSNPAVYHSLGMNYNCDEALNYALKQFEVTNGEWLSECVLTYVIGEDGLLHKAWSRTLGYQPLSDPPAPYQRDILYANVQNRKLVAVHPQVKGILSLNTMNCRERTSNCRTVSEEPARIDTGDKAVNAAHNYAIATYEFFFNHFGRDSINDKGMTMISRVHYDEEYNNAFWDGRQMTYGDGDGELFRALSMDPDVVAHELTHGITEFTSDLIYRKESGALNEAMSDIFGACVDRQEGASIRDTWLIGEGIYTPKKRGDALRNMADPKQEGDYDYYPTRYKGKGDNGGVHWNSGIANLAFVLLVQGGMHPRGHTNVDVPALDPDDFDNSLLLAAKIFYQANTACLTSSSGFLSARLCTLMYANGTDTKEAVNAAWDAVGVPRPSPTITLENGVAKTGQRSQEGGFNNYKLENIPVNHKVRCALRCDNGDADLYVRFEDEPIIDTDSTLNDCASFSDNSNERCKTSTVMKQANGTAYITVHAFRAFRDMRVKCKHFLPKSGSTKTCKARGETCSTRSDCCSSNKRTCDGATIDSQVCKRCKDSGSRCTRDTQCCSEKCRINGHCR